MKFSTILTSAFFALFVFTATATFATTTNDITSSDKKEIKKDKEDVDTIVFISGRTAQVTDRDANRLNVPYFMNVKVMKGLSVVHEDSANTETATFDLSDLDAGGYTMMIQTPTGTQRQLIVLE